MEAGMSGASGQCAAVSVRGSELGNATPQYPDTEAKCAKGTVRPLRTAQMDCVPRVRPFSLLSSSFFNFFPQHYHYHIYTYYNMASHRKHAWRGGVNWKRSHSVDWHRFPVHDNVTTLSSVHCSLDLSWVSQSLLSNNIWCVKYNFIIILVWSDLKSNELVPVTS